MRRPRFRAPGSWRDFDALRALAEAVVIAAIVIALVLVMTLLSLLFSQG